MDATVYLFAKFEAMKESVIDNWIDVKCSYDIFDEENSIFKDSIHFENMKRVPECTYSGEHQDIPSTGVKYVDSLTPIRTDRYTGNQGDSKMGKIGIRNGTAGVTGTTYEHGLEAWVARWNYSAERSWVWNEYDIGGNYNKLTGTLDYCKYSFDGWDYTKYSHSTNLEIIGDGKILYSVTVDNNASTYPINIDVDVTGISTLKIYFYDITPSCVGSSWLLGNLALS